MDNESVMCFPAKILEQMGIPDKFSKDVEKYFFGVLKQENIHFVERQKAEQDESFKQIIPYHILKSNDRYFVYKRGKKGGEDRLHTKLSLGIGGHINTNDVDPNTTSDIGTYASGADRELAEEVKLPDYYTMWTLGCIYDDSTTVGRVHFGFVHLLDLKGEGVTIRDEALDFYGWLTKDDLVKERESLEEWSKIVLDNFLE